MADARNASGWSWLRRALWPVTLLGSLYLYFLFVLRPELLLHCQSPIFFADWPAFSEHVRVWPGGLVEYLGAGLSQTLAAGWLGAAVLTGGLGIVYLLTRALLGAKPGTPVAFVPAILLIVLLNRYTLPLSVMLALCLTLAGSWAYVRLGSFSAPMRVLVAIVLCGGLYVVAGGASLLFASICGVLELITRRSWLVGIIILLLGAVIPLLGGDYMYGIGRGDAFLRLTAVMYDFSPPIASTALYAFFPLALVFGSVVQRKSQSAVHSAEPGKVKGSRRHAARAASEAHAFGAAAKQAAVLGVVRIGLVVVIAGAAIGLSFDGHRRAILAADYYARSGQWVKVLEAARPLEWSGFVPSHGDDERLARTCVGFHFPVSAAQPALLLPTYNVAMHDINQALAHTGRLLDDMFRYPQRMGVSVVRLLPDDMGAYVTHSYNPDILLQLGDVNEAERVTCECLANVGWRPWLLERLVAISALKGHPQAARTALAVMARDPGQRSRVESLRRELDSDPTLARWEQVRVTRSRMFRIDRTGHIAGLDPDEEALRYLLMTNPQNRMAFDYLMAHYLLTLRTDQITGNVRHLREFGYTSIPRHCEEAILLRASMDGKMPNLAGLSIRPETSRRFEAFQQAIDAHGGPGGPSVRDALVNAFGDTYWFYALFGNTFWRDGAGSTSRPAEGP